MTFDKFLEQCKKAEQIYIYGAGVNAKRVTYILKKRNIPISGYLVSHRADNPYTLLDLPVNTIREFKENQKEPSESFIIVSIGVKSEAYKPIFQYIVQYQLRNVFFLSNDLLNVIKEEFLLESEALKTQRFLGESIYYLGSNIPVEVHHTVLCMKDREGKEYHWRFKHALMDDPDENNVQNLFSKMTALEECESLYGTYHILHHLSFNHTGTKKTCAVYMACTHTDRKITQNPLPQWVIPIQVGAAFTQQKICNIQDNEEENISEKNGNYSECTALYWMWKHAPKTDYIGLCHYRRHFDMEEQELHALMGSNMDVLVTTPTFVKDGVEAFFSTYTPHEDLNMLLRAIEDVCPEYLPTAKLFFKARFFSPCNLFIMKYELFHQYAQFVFPVTFQVERLYDELQFYRKDRYMGYLVECLMGIYLMKHKDTLKIAYTDMIFYASTTVT